MRVSVIFLALLGLQSSVQAETFTLKADQIYHNKDILAIGKVNTTITHQDNTYNITASKALYSSCSVFLNDGLFYEATTGLVLSADKALYNHCNKNLSLKQVKGATAHGNFLLSADAFNSTGNNIFEFESFTFACGMTCGEEVWKLRAQNALVNRNLETIQFRHLYLDLKDRTVLYLPFLTTPTLGAKRNSGFLVPSIYGDRQIGFMFRIPYYFNLKPHLDLTIAPHFSSIGDVLHEMELRHLTEAGGWQMKGYLAAHQKKNKGVQYAGYLKGQGNFKLLKGVETGVEINRIFDSHKTLAKKYKINTNDILVSRYYLNQAFKHYYLSLEPFKIVQDLRPEARFSTITAMPKFQSFGQQIIARNKFYKGTLFFETTMANLAHFTENPDKQLLNHFSGIAGVNVQFKTWPILTMRPSIGLDLISENKAKFYEFDSIALRDNRPSLTPELSAKLELPLSGVFKGVSPVFLEPSAALILAQNSQRNFPKLEMSFMEIANASLSSFQNIVDQYQTGSRVEYGVRGYITNTTCRINAALHGAYSLYKPNLYGLHSIFKESRSASYAISSSVNYRNMNLQNKLWLRPKNLQPVQNIVDLQTSFKKTSLNLDYIFFDSKYYLNDNLSYKHEVGSSIWYDFYRNWAVNVQFRHKLGTKIDGWPTKRIIQGIGLRYKVDCLFIDVRLTKNFFKLRDLEPYTSFSVNFGIPLFNS